MKSTLPVCNDGTRRFRLNCSAEGFFFLGLAMIGSKIVPSRSYRIGVEISKSTCNTPKNGTITKERIRAEMADDPTDAVDYGLRTVILNS